PRQRLEHRRGPSAQVLSHHQGRHRPRRPPHLGLERHPCRHQEARQGEEAMTDTRNPKSGTLTDRYVYAVIRSLPESQRADIERELRASIADAIETRIEAGEAPEAAERATLTELGDPMRLAGEYADRPSWLIGPKYF